MKFKEFGNRELPTIIFLHGGGLSWWSMEKIIKIFSSENHVVAPIIDGHGEDGKTNFISIDDSADKLISFIDANCGGRVFALAGLSIGAQIITEILSRRSNITEFAVIESALVYPIKGTRGLAVPTYKMFYGLIRKKWFSKLQAKILNVPEEMFERYYKDSLNITKESLVNITLSNGNYILKNIIKNTKAKVLIIVGEKELKIMKKSAERLHNSILNSHLYIAKKMGHGELSLVNHEEYVSLIRNFL
ncbi:alpha/beta fold hydrolase [Clostridium senegalense]|uniref:alpha/beta fold hydrolase n=1 Tax=Clostridium senegalense TaxID=1465809 RepID=UPI000288B735|nr:alpha/beta hydrolase [Clostridium senegalense]